MLSECLNLKLDPSCSLTKQTVQEALDLISNYSFKKKRKSVEYQDGYKKSTIDYFKEDVYWSHPNLTRKLVLKGGVVKQLKDLQVHIKIISDYFYMKKLASRLSS
jgi:hypothetical protein